MKNIIIGFMLLCMASSCSKALEENPKSLASENFYNTVPEVRSAINAIYGPIRTTNGVSLNYPAQLEGMADYGYSRGTQAPVSLYQGLDNTNINRVGVIWDSFFQTIRNANLVIANVPNGTGLTEQDKVSALAEAKYLRSLTYFALVRNWGAVPLRTEANMTVADVPRSPVKDVYALILQDALAAEAGLGDAATEIGRPSKWAAKTLLTEIYLSLNDWQSAATKSKEVIDSKKYALVEVTTSEDFQKIFGPDIVNTPEEIFYFKFNRQQGFGILMYAHRTTSVYNYYGPGGAYAQYTDLETNSVIKNWDNRDLRKAHIFYNVDIGLGATSVLFRKFRDRQATNVGGANDYPWYRYADLLLFHAEADARVNNAPTVSALESLNIIHRRAYGYPSQTPSIVDFKLADFTLSTFLNKVIEERGYETMYEGKRWLDLKRLGIAKERILQVKNIVVADKHMLWPIPNSEILYNKALTTKDQNPGY
jgi:hypothetical protein